ncbi:cupin-like domain-containing protein [Ulvibacterium sp.]|uniref:cupin-like domain-containing protein n=1 Tax=Ulvibacterium sp. TaxID=2665914 RepID=UPI003BA8C12D
MDIVNDILAKSDSIEELMSVDAETFKKNYFRKKKPILIKGLAKDWGATRKWNFDFFLNLKDDQDILLLSDNFIQDDNRYSKSTFKKFIQNLKDATLNNEVTKDYLTTLDIFKYYPHLIGDIDFSLFEELTQTNDITAWIGPSGTISGFHSDTPSNMYAQIKGKKMFIICSTEFNENMYPSDKHIFEAVASQVDINNFDSQKFPRFMDTDFKIVILEPGDVLYLPKKWWHYVQSLDTSISISNFGYTKHEAYTLKVFERIKHSLHKRGYYKAKNCFCCEQ